MKSLFLKMLMTAILLAPNAGAGQWDNAAFLNTPRAGASAVTWDGKIFVFGGKSLNNSVLNTVETYDSTTKKWDNAAVPAFSQPRYNAGAVIFQNNIYLLGGRTINDVLSNVEVYDPVQNSWSDVQDLREPREGHSACYFNNQIYAIGGQHSSNYLIDEIEWYDSENNSWEIANFDLPYQRSAHFFSVYNNEYYMFGGTYWGLKSSILKTTWSESGYAWEQVGELSEPRAYGATARIDSLIFIIGGETSSGKSNLVEIFNAETGAITRGDDMNMSHSGQATAVLHGQIYSIGGYEIYSNEPVNHVHRYTPDSTTVHVKEDLASRKESGIIAYPNPFEKHTTIQLSGPFIDAVELRIYSIRGQLIRTITSNQQHLFQANFTWDGTNEQGKNVPNGIYIALLKTENHQQAIKLTYVK